jgi:glycine/D-amino acid oxidase-like deaminating enzyme
MSAHPPEDVLIVGAGVVGVSIAYFLSLRGVKSTIVDAVGVGSGATAAAGGMLPSTYTHGASRAMCVLSFDLHDQLARALNGEATYGYRRVSAIAMQATAPQDVPLPRAGVVQIPPCNRMVCLPTWVDCPAARRADRVASKKTIAQLDPVLFVNALFDASRAKLRVALACGVETESDSEGAVRVTGVRIRDGDATSVLRAKTVVLAMGAWCGHAREWIAGVAPVSGFRAYALCLRPRALSLSPPSDSGSDSDATPLTTSTSSVASGTVAASDGSDGAASVGATEAEQRKMGQDLGTRLLIVNFYDVAGEKRDMKISPKADGTLVVVGMADCTPPPPSPADVVGDTEALDALRRCAQSVAPVAGATRSDVCYARTSYLPVSPDNEPSIGPIAGCGGLYMAAGHKCVRVCQSPVLALLCPPTRPRPLLWHVSVALSLTCVASVPSRCARFAWRVRCVRVALRFVAFRSALLHGTPLHLSPLHVSPLRFDASRCV